MDLEITIDQPDQGTIHDGYLTDRRIQAEFTASWDSANTVKLVLLTYETFRCDCAALSWTFADPNTLDEYREGNADPFGPVVQGSTRTFEEKSFS